MALQNTKNREFIETKDGYDIHRITVRKGEREDQIDVKVPANPKVAEKEDENYWELFQRQYLADKANTHRQTAMISEEEKKERHMKKLKELQEAGLSKSEIVKLLQD